jgi:hypothetical protein
MPQPPPPQNSEPGQNTEQAGRHSGTPPQGAPPAGRPTPPSGAPGARIPGESGAYPARPPAPGYGPPQAYPPPGAYGYGPPPGAAGPGPGRPYQPGPAQPTQAYGAYAAPTGGAPTTSTTVATEAKPAHDLAVPKLAAGAGAAATSAILGSFFGDMGTVTGAALGSVFSAIVTWVYQRSLERTGQTVKAKIKLPGGRTVDVSGKTEVPPPIAPGGETGQARVYVTPNGGADRPTEVMSAVPSGATTVSAAPAKPNSRKRILVLTGFTVVVFAIGMLAITGIELVKGSPLSKTSSSTSTRSGGTSLGSVLGGGSNAASTESSTSEKATSEESATDEPTEEETSSPSTDDEDSPTTAPRRSGAGADESSAPSRSAKATPTPTPTPNARSGGAADGGGDANAQGPVANGGGGADAPPQQREQE